MRFLRIAATYSFTLLAAGFLAVACGDDESATSDGNGGDGSGASGTGASGGGPPGDSICLLHNCESDAHCGACSDGRVYCLVAEKRCVACGDGASGGCPEGMECSSWGNCVPEGLTCPTDAEGIPQISCTNSGDCAACAPNHLVCNTATGSCDACTENDTSECQSTDICVDGQCAPACSDNCQVDADCNKCPSAKACNAHKCSECGPTYACPAGEVCMPNGTCQRECGLQGNGSCNSSADCSGCENGTTCHLPINGPPGTCGPDANGCSDLGNGVVVLPDPWNQYTNTCSNDNDCDGVGAQYNVGKALRDLTGFDEIGDGNVTYPMNVCADITIANTSCGICVPCEVDADCGEIDIDQISAQLFGPIGSLAAALLLDQVFGAASHTVYFYCETVAAGYGVCVPCPGLLNDCGIGGGGGGGSGNCDHGPDQEGGPLDPSCGSCEETVCAVDSYCCDPEGAWDGICVDEAADLCSSDCHDECTIGEAMEESCSACVADVCANDPYCCDLAQGSWDSYCVDEVDDYCASPCP